MENILDVIQWIATAILIPSVAWLAQKRVRSARTDMEVHNVYKELYEDVGKTILELNDEIRRLRLNLSKLERIISRAANCRYYNDCPVRDELWNYENVAGKQVGKRGAAKRQHKHCNGATDASVDNTCGKGGAVAFD